MKKVLLTLLGIIVVIGVLAGAGFSGYRIGYQRGTDVTADGNAVPLIRGFRVDPQEMPMHNFGRGYDHSFNSRFFPGGYMMRGHGMGFGFFSPLMSLGHILFWAAVIWFVYWLFKKSGWRITREKGPEAAPKTEG